MRSMTRIPTPLALFFLLASSAIAADEVSVKTSVATRDFTLNMFDPDQGTNSSQSTATQSQSTTNSPGAANQAPGALPRVSAVQPAPLTAGGKWRYYLKTTYGAQSFAWTAAGAGIKQAQGSVPEWGGGMEGYGKRYASSFGQKVVNHSVRVTLQTLLHEDPRYRASGKSGIFSRTLAAASQVFIVYKDSGGTRPAYSRWAGNFSAAYISRQWHPDSYHTTGDYLTSGLTSIGIDAAKNVWKEFWPDIKQWLHH